MAQSNILTREQAVYIGEESTFGVTPSGSFPNELKRAIVEQSLKMDGLAREMLDVDDVRVRRADAIQPVPGLKLASKAALKWYLKATPAAAQLTRSSMTAPAPLTPRLALRHALGAEHAALGSTVAATGADPSEIEVQAGEGARFKKGTLIAVQVGSAMEWALVTNVEGDTLSVTPDFSSNPAEDAIVRNLYNYAPAESHSRSLTVQVAYVGDSAAQYTLNGCHGDLAFEFGEWGKLAKMGLDLTGVDYTTPTAPALATATASDDMGGAFALTPKVYLSALGGAMTPPLSRTSPLVCEKVAIEYKNAWEKVRDPGANSTVAGVVNTAGRPRVAKAMVTLRYDSGYPTAFNDQARYSLTIVQRVDATPATQASFWIWMLNNVKLVAMPKLTNVGNRLYMDLEFNALQDADYVTVGSETGTDLDFIYAPLRVAFG